MAKTKAVRQKRKKKELAEGVIPVFSSEGKETGKYEINRRVFTGDVNKGVIYQAVVMYNANKRRGTASTKTVSDTRGGGRKPWRQKGTGRARVSSIRSPLWTGGGIIFGPHPRDYRYQIPKRAKNAALVSSINSKLNEKKIIGIDAIKLKEPKTKYFKKMMDSLKIKDKALFVLDNIDEPVKRSSRNIKGVQLKHYMNVNALDILHSDTIVISVGSLEGITKRVS
ncbi:50S ribosomal protein L4 [Candidatus Omnitrophota bacterium]